MSDINPNNFEGANVTIVGKAGGPATVRTFNNGGSQAELSVAVSKGYKDKNSGEWVDKGTDWYTLVGAESYATENWPEVGPGDKVRIDNARLESRPYLSKDGEPKTELKLQFGTVVVLERKQDRQPAAAAVSTPF